MNPSSRAPPRAGQAGGLPDRRGGCRTRSRKPWRKPPALGNGSVGKQEGLRTWSDFWLADALQTRRVDPRVGRRAWSFSASGLSRGAAARDSSPRHARHTARSPSSIMRAMLADCRRETTRATQESDLEFRRAPYGVTPHKHIYNHFRADVTRGFMYRSAQKVTRSFARLHTHDTAHSRPNSAHL